MIRRFLLMSYLMSLMRGIDEVRAWQNRLLDAVYPIVYLRSTYIFASSRKIFSPIIVFQTTDACYFNFNAAIDRHCAQSD